MSLFSKIIQGVTGVAEGVAGYFTGSVGEIRQGINTETDLIGITHNASSPVPSLTSNLNTQQTTTTGIGISTNMIYLIIGIILVFLISNSNKR
jgi:hypothetical protein